MTLEDLEKKPVRDTVFTWGFIAKAIIAPIAITCIVGAGGFFVGHTQLEGHPETVIRLNDSLVRLGKLEARLEMLYDQIGGLSVDMVSDRFTGHDGQAMEDRLRAEIRDVESQVRALRNDLNK